MDEEQMHMILDAADDKRLAIEMRDDTAEVTIDPLAQHLVLKKRSALFGREDYVQKNFCERLRHNVRVRVSWR